MLAYFKILNSFHATGNCIRFMHMCLCFDCPLLILSLLSCISLRIVVMQNYVFFQYLSFVIYLKSSSKAINHTPMNIDVSVTPASKNGRSSSERSGSSPVVNLTPVLTSLESKLCFLFNYFKKHYANGTLRVIVSGLLVNSSQ